MEQDRTSSKIQMRIDNEESANTHNIVSMPHLLVLGAPNHSPSARLDHVDMRVLENTETGNKRIRGEKGLEWPVQNGEGRGVSGQWLMPTR